MWCILARRSVNNFISYIVIKIHSFTEVYEELPCVFLVKVFSNKIGINDEGHFTMEIEVENNISHVNNYITRILYYIFQN
jgi:hypothetical protein